MVLLTSDINVDNYLDGTTAYYATICATALLFFVYLSAILVLYSVSVYASLAFLVYLL